MHRQIKLYCFKVLIMTDSLSLPYRQYALTFAGFKNSFVGPLCGCMQLIQAKVNRLVRSCSIIQD